MLRRRWRWIKDCDGWAAFATWCDDRPRAERVELEAGLAVLLALGPEHDTYSVGEDLYVIYACCKRTVLWLIVGVAAPGERYLVPLAWGSQPSEAKIRDAAKDAADQLGKWRGRSGGTSPK